MSVSTINPRGFFLERQGRADQKNKIVNLLRSESVVGRDEGKANIILISDYVSRTHCSIELDAAGKMFIEDLVSSNGTFVNDVKIKERTEVKENDKLGIGCDTKTMEKNLDDKLFFFYTVKVGHVFKPDEIIELPDSDEEDIDHLCEDLTKNSGIEVQKSLNNDVIELSDEEEENKFKKWEKKLSQGRSPPPAQQPDDCQSDSSSAFPDPLPTGLTSVAQDPLKEVKEVPDSSDSSSAFPDPLPTGLASIAQDPLKEVKKEVPDSNKKTPDLSPESSPTKANDEIAAADPVPATPNQLETATPGSSNFYFNGTVVKLKNLTVELSLLGQNEIDKYLNGDSSDDDVLHCPRKPKNTARTKKLKKVLPSDKEKYVGTAKIMKNLNAICDAESSEDDDKPKKKKVKNVSKAAGSKTALKKVNGKKSTLSRHRDDLEVVPTNNSLKIIMRRKSTAEIDVEKTSDFPLPVPNEIMRSVSRSICPDPIAAPVTKQKLTVSQVTRKINIPTKNPVPIIEPLAMRKRRQSTCAEATAPIRKLSTSESKDRSRMPKRRMTVCDPPIDMFAAAAQIRNGKRRMSVDQSSSDLKQDLHRERAEKLRKIADEKKQAENKETTSKKDRVVSVPKVKVTNRNRGDFLTALPVPCAPPKKPSNGQEVSFGCFQLYTGPSGSSKIPASVVKTALPVPVSPSPSVLISNFRQEHVKPIFKTAAPATSTLTSPAPTDASSDGICNNLDFYGHDFPNLLSTSEPQVMGFYNQMSFSQNTETAPTPVVASKRHDGSILKSPLTRRSTIKKRVSFPEDRLLAEVRTYELDDHFCPLETQAHVEEVMPTQDLVTKENVIERILMWNPKSLLEPEQNNNDNTIVYNELLIEIKKAFGKKYANSAKNYWEHLNLNAVEVMPNGVARLTILSSESHRGYRQDSLLLLKVYQPLKPVETVKFGYIMHTSTTDYKTKIVVYTKFNKQDLADVAVLKCRSLYYIQPEMDKLCALERQATLP